MQQRISCRQDGQKQESPDRRPEPDLEPPQEGAVALVQLFSDFLRIAHGVHGLLDGYVGGKAPRLQGGGVILQMGGELRRDGGVIGGEADVRAHPGAEAVDMVAVHGVTTFKWESRIGYSNQRAG